MNSNEHNQLMFTTHSPYTLSYLTQSANCLKKSFCECLLHTDETICFVELKEREKKYTKEAIAQLENTIRLVKQNHSIDDFTFKQAYICNRKRPTYNEARNSVCADFAARNKVALHIGIRIGEME